MTRGGRLRIAAAMSLVAVAGGLVVLAVQSWRLPLIAQEQDAQLLGRAGPGSAWSREAGLTPTLLGLRDDVAYRRAISLFRLARTSLDPTETPKPNAVVESVEAGAALGRIEASGAARARRSEAANLVAVLAGETAEVDDNPTELDRAADLLRSAIRLDRSNEAAKANLERLLERQGSNLGSAGPTAPGNTGDKAGAGDVQEGY